MTAVRSPFEDTSVAVIRSQEQIRKMLRGAGAQGVQFTEEWGDPPSMQVRFVWPLGARMQAVRLMVTPLAADTRRSVEQRERQAWRGIAHYLEGTLKAAAFGLIRFEDIFLSFMELEPQGRTFGEAVMDELAAGRPLAIGPGTRT